MCEFFLDRFEFDQKRTQGVLVNKFSPLVCDHAGLVINKFYREVARQAG